MIKIVNLVVKYGWRKEPILKGISMSFEGKFLILGPNGSGKTTLFRAIAGLTPIESGEIIIDGIELSKIYGKAGILSINLSEVYRILYQSALDHLKLYMDLVDGDIDLAFNILNDLGVDINLLRKRKPWELSAGQLKAFSTTLALASRANNILLDEPFEQLDPARKSRLIKYLRSIDSTLLLNTHETWLLPLLSDWKTILMFEGKLYGPLDTAMLLNASIVHGETRDAIITFEVSGDRYSIVEGKEGQALTELATLDKVYELAIR